MKLLNDDILETTEVSYITVFTEDGSCVFSGKYENAIKVLGLESCVIYIVVMNLKYGKYKIKVLNKYDDLMQDLVPNKY